MKAIVCVDKKWGIGKKNDLLFHLPEDMAFFKAQTTGKVCCMGYNTLLSFPNGKPLPRRVNVVLAPEGVTRDDCTVVHTLKELAAALKAYPSGDVYVIGGAMFYRTMLPYCDEVLVTKVDADGGAETFYENLDRLPEWDCVSVSEPIWSNGYEIRFTTYKNKAVKAFE